MPFINNKDDLRLALKQECFKIKGMNFVKAFILQDYVSLFIWSLRNMEYHFNKSNYIHKLLFVIFHSIWNHYSVKTGITIPKNVCDIGLTLYHYGSITVNGRCCIGKNCCIMNNVNIGTNLGGSEAPKIGNNVYIGPGTVVFGNITIADGCYLGANSVVNKSILEPNSVVVGIPAKKIKTDPIPWFVKHRLSR